MNTQNIQNDFYLEYTITSSETEIVLSVWESKVAVATIVFIPAIMVHPLIYEPLFSGFSKNGFTVIGVHPVGHGNSSHKVKNFTIFDIVQKAAMHFTFARTNYDLPVIVMGSSQGGIVAAALATKDNRILAAFPQNVLMTELPDSILISRFPRFFRKFYVPAKRALRFLALLLAKIETTD
jgi:alpha-beta hydrolase superfamily lysophospholipase